MLRVLILLVMGLCGFTALAVDITDAPFYMMNYYEVTHVSREQKGHYFKNLATQVTFIKGQDQNQKKFAVKDFEVAALSEQTWNELMTSVYKSCTMLINQKVCKKLEDSRLSALEEGALRGNQPAGSADDHSTSQPTTLPPSK